MNLSRRISALEASIPYNRDGRSVDMKMLSMRQLELIATGLRSGIEINGNSYLGMSEFTDDELAELETALHLCGVLPPGKSLHNQPEPLTPLPRPVRTPRKRKAHRP